MYWNYNLNKLLQLLNIATNNFAGLHATFGLAEMKYPALGVRNFYDHYFLYKLEI